MPRSSRIPFRILLRFALAAVLLLACLPAFAEPEELPASFDLRDVDGHAYIGPAKDQGPLGSCFSFSTTAVAESTYNRAMGLYDDEAERFSESFIIWSLAPSYEAFDPYLGSETIYDDLQAVVEHGICREDDFPYVLEDPVEYHWDAPRVRFDSWHRLPMNDVETIKRTMLQIGGIYAVIAADHDFAYYEGGVYANSLSATDTLDGALSSTNHGISLMGWDDDAGENGAWILRNSWGESWGSDGYMLIDYFTSGVALKTAYLVYGDWQGEDFSLLNADGLVALNVESSFQPAAHGMYEWGGNDASMANSGSIHATADVEAGNPYVQAMFLWAGKRAAVTNTGSLLAEAFTDDGMATAYGICMQGGSVFNAGGILAVSGSGSGRATAYGAKQFGYDMDAAFLNTGTIEARSATEDGWALGVEGNILGSLVNEGTILASGEASSTGLVTEKVASALNAGLIRSDATDGEAYGVSVAVGGFTNDGEVRATASGTATGLSERLWSSAMNAGVIAASAQGGYGIGADLNGSFLENMGTIEANSDFVALGLRGVQAVFENSGAISAVSASGKAAGAYLDASALTNFGIVSGASMGGEAYGAILLNGSVLTNQGQIIGDTLLDGEAVLNGNGTYFGDVLNMRGVVSPGNSIGAVTISGDYVQGDDATLVVELEGDRSDVLSVAGSATLSGELRISLLDYVGSDAFLIIESPAVSGAFSEVTAPAVLAVSLDAGLAGLTLDVTRNTYASLAANADQAAVGGALDAFRSAADGDMADVLLGVDNMDLAGVRGALGDMAPGMHAAARLAMVMQRYRAGDGILDRLSARAFRQAAGEPADDAALEGRARVWGNVSVAAGRSEGRMQTPDVALEERDMVLGVESSPGAWTCGLAATLLDQDVESGEDGSVAESTAVRGYAYALWNRGGFHALGALGAGRTRVSTTREVPFLGREAQSQHWSGDVSVGAGIGYTLVSGPWRLQPEARLTGLYVHEDGVDEHGAGAMDLDIESADMLFAQSRLGFRLGREFRCGKAAVLPQLSAGWVHEFRPALPRVRASFDEYGPDFDIEGADLAADSFSLGLDLNVVAERIQGGVFLDLARSDDGSSTTRQFGLQLSGTF